METEPFRIMNYFKLYDDVKDCPRFATEKSACFDIRAYLGNGIETVMAYDNLNHKRSVLIDPHQTQSLPERKVVIYPGWRVLIPTGLILDIPAGHSVRLHPRSGLALKRGLMLANCEGVIDEDYVDPLYLLIYNSSMTEVCIEHGERIAQGELVKNIHQEGIFVINRIFKKPGQKTDRDGGFGSTGTE